MKNRYFGDIKDLFTYDLVERLILKVPSLKRFTFVTMLTPDDGRNDGNKLFVGGRAGYRNSALVAYLEDCVAKGRRNVSRIRPYFEERGIPITIYGEDRHFDRRNRAGYFEGINDSDLARALILVDPDNGLEGRNPSERQLLLSEAKRLYERMDERSALMLFQHFRRERHDLTLSKESARLARAVGQAPLWACDREIVFFFLTRDATVRQGVERSLRHYANDYGCVRTGPAR